MIELLDLVIHLEDARKVSYNKSYKKFKSKNTNHDGDQKQYGFKSKFQSGNNKEFE